MLEPRLKQKRSYFTTTVFAKTPKFRPDYRTFSYRLAVFTIKAASNGGGIVGSVEDF